MTDDALDEPGMSAEAFAVSDGAYALLVADFSDSAAALQAYEELHGLEDGLHIKIEAVVVVKRDSDGAVDVEKTSDHSTVRGLGWGVAGGMLLGVIYPPSIIGSAIVAGAAGAGAGKFVERHHDKELAEKLADVIEPGHSGLLVLVFDPGVVKVRESISKANRIVESAVDKAVADDLKATANEIEKGSVG